MKLKEKDKRALMDFKNLEPSLKQKLINRIPARILIKFFINFCSKEQVNLLYEYYKKEGMTKKLELLSRGYKTKYRMEFIPKNNNI